MKKIGILTSGGDSPGMNAAVMSVAKSAASYGMPLVGIKRGYNGLLRLSPNLEDDVTEMQLDTILDIADRPGTFLRTARCREFLDPEMRHKALLTVRALDIEGMVVIGGDGSYQGGMRLCELGVPCIGIPGTIDNDLAYTDMTLGYESAVDICTQAVRAIRATSRSHDRPHVVEVMGRHCGDIALRTAAATGSEILLVPEVPWSVEDVASRLSRLLYMGNTRATIVVAEGAYESMAPFNVYKFFTEHKVDCWEREQMNTENLTKILKMMTGAEVRHTVLGYIQRGVDPVPADSAFAFEAGHLAVDLLAKGIGNQAIGVKNGRVFYMPFDEALKQERPFNINLYNMINRI